MTDELVGEGGAERPEGTVRTLVVDLPLATDLWQTNEQTRIDEVRKLRPDSCLTDSGELGQRLTVKRPGLGFRNHGRYEKPVLIAEQALRDPEEFNLAVRIVLYDH